MSITEGILLTLFLGVCTIPGIVAGALASKKKDSYEFIIVLLPSIAFLSPLVFFFGWYLLFDRPHARAIFDRSNVMSALGIMMIYGGPAGVISGSSSLLFSFVSYKIFSRKRTFPEEPIQPPVPTRGNGP